MLTEERVGTATVVASLGFFAGEEQAPARLAAAGAKSWPGRGTVRRFQPQPA